MNPEALPSEEEQFRTRVVLDFFRHDEKDLNNTEPKKTDEEVELTPKGRHDARVHGKLADIKFAIATATDRVRAQQTAGYHMAGMVDGVTGDETSEELEQKINKGTKYGSKTRIDGRLNTYSNQISNIATIVLKYIEVAKNFDRLYESTEVSKRETNELQRFFGSHQGVTEPFLAKLIEMRRGVEEKDKFLSMLNKGGFDFSEGFKIMILNTDNESEPKIQISYKKEKNGEVFEFDEEITVDEIKELSLKE